MNNSKESGWENFQISRKRKNQKAKFWRKRRKKKEKKGKGKTKGFSSLWKTHFPAVEKKLWKTKKWKKQKQKMLFSKKVWKNAKAKMLFVFSNNPEILRLKYLIKCTVGKWCLKRDVKRQKGKTKKEENKILFMVFLKFRFFTVIFREKILLLLC